MLSFFSIFGIQNNMKKNFLQCIIVVNCFHFSVSLGYKTTTLWLDYKWIQLWIAFIFQYLWDTKQHRINPVYSLSGCELLSFFSIFGIQNNNLILQVNHQLVVNCFHFSVSLGYKTTFLFVLYLQLKLWIAFIFQYLWDTKQLCCLKAIKERGCELLSFFSIFGIQNNERCSLHALN